MTENRGPRLTIAAHPLAIMIRPRQSGAAACSAALRIRPVVLVEVDPAAQVLQQFVGNLILSKYPGCHRETQSRLEMRGAVLCPDIARRPLMKRVDRVIQVVRRQFLAFPTVESRAQPPECLTQLAVVSNGGVLSNEAPAVFRSSFHGIFS
jgi:hypothetical protein